LLLFVQNLDLKGDPTMPDHKAHLKKLLRIGDIGIAIEELCDATEQNGQKDLNNNLLNLSGRYHRAVASKRKGVITDAHHATQLAKLTESLSYYIEEYESSDDFDFKPLKSNQPEPQTVKRSTPPPALSDSPETVKVFISYSTQDRDIAHKVKTQLEAANIKVTIDYQDFLIGENLMDSINKHLKDNNIVLSLISKNSLKSQWASIQSMIMFHTESMTDKLFIPAFLDNFLFDRSFVRKALTDIQKEIKEIRLEIDERNKNNWSIEDLAPDLEKHEKLANNLPGIVKRFRDSQPVNLTPLYLEEGVKKIIKHIQNVS
jgi:hypothetical protein